MVQVCIISILLCISGIGAWFKITVFSYLSVVSNTVVTISFATRPLLDWYTGNDIDMHYRFHSLTYFSSHFTDIISVKWLLKYCKL